MQATKWCKIFFTIHLVAAFLFKSLIPDVYLIFYSRIYINKYESQDHFIFGKLFLYLYLFPHTYRVKNDKNK